MLNILRRWYFHLELLSLYTHYPCYHMFLMASTVPPPQLFYQGVPPPPKLPGILHPVHPPCRWTGWIVKLPEQVLAAKQR